jgi:hypothetical protein
MKLTMVMICTAVLAIVPASVTAAIAYVDANSANPVPPYNDWSTAATNIQDAVDAAGVRDLILVTNGTYRNGGRVAIGSSSTNRVVVTKGLTVQSVNGPAFTVIEGYQVSGATNGPAAVRCVYLEGGASLIGFTLTNGATATQGKGGGVYGWYSDTTKPPATLSNCIITGNAAYNGGGAYGVNVYNCLVVGNSATYGGGIYGAFVGAYPGLSSNCTLKANAATYGGGAYAGSFENCKFLANSATSTGGGATGADLSGCLVLGNSAANGGGVSGGDVRNSTVVSNSASWFGGYNGSSVENSILYYNTASVAFPNFSDGSALDHTCAQGLVSARDPNSFADDPLFSDPVNGDFHLQASSSCINAGRNALFWFESGPLSSDLDGNVRVAGGTVDVGAYEFQDPTSVISYHWLQSYALPIDGSADFQDPDSDGMNNFQEWVAGTDPTNALSSLRLYIQPTNTSVSLTWNFVAGRVYWLERATTAISRFTVIATNLIVWEDRTHTIIDTNALGFGRSYYRVGVTFP